MYGYVYMTINLINGKRYIGQHQASKLYNNGVVNIRAIECPEGFVHGVLKHKVVV